jgi:protocadherin Fat 1/2/3
MLVWIYNVIKKKFKAVKYLPICRYTLTVSALDSANAGMRKQSSARVTVLVEDVNDNDPLFEMVEKEIWFDENEPAGTRVIR